MQVNMIGRAVAFAFIVIATSAAIGCRSSPIEGRYEDGGPVLLQLRPKGEAKLTLYGTTFPCTYNVARDKVHLDCTNKEGRTPGRSWPQGFWPESEDFTVNLDGSLTTLDYPKPLRKTA